MTQSIVRSTPLPTALTLNKRTLIIAALGSVVLSAVLFSQLFSAKAPTVDKGGNTYSRPSSPPPVVDLLADSYLQSQRPKREPAPVAALLALPALSGQSELARYLEQMEVERLQRQELARRSKVSFDDLNSERPNKISGLPSMGGVAPGGAQPRPAENARDEANRQDEKLAFLHDRRTDETELDEELSSPRSPDTLLAGTIIPGLLITGLNSDLPGEILGQVSQNVYDTVTGHRLLLPQGTKVLGVYDARISYGQERMLIVWTRLILPNGRSIAIGGMPGVDVAGNAGLSDQVNNHYAKILSGIVLGSLVGAGAQVAEGRNYTTSNPSFSELAVQGAAKNVNEVGQEITKKNLNIQPTLEIRPGYRFNIFVNKDITLEPYEP